MVRRDLTNKEIEQMGREAPGSAAKYLEERRKEIAAQKAKAREEDDKEQWIKQFVAAGGDPRSAQSAYQAHRNQQAEATAKAAEQTASAITHRRIGQAL